jgi:spoIIIJ-associated protein
MTESEHTVEATGADVEAAIAAGLASLGANRSKVDVEVLDEGRRGMLGVGAREARVRLVVKSSQASASLPTPTEIEPDLAGADEEEQVSIARGALLELLALMGLENPQVSARRATAAPGEESPPMVLEVSGPGTDALIGRRGDTLAALQYVLRLIVGQEVGGRTSLIVDVNGHKARRAESLRKLAGRMAEQALRTGRRLVLEPMPPHERRIVHLSLRDHPDVITESIGEGNRRKVTIIPQRR